MIIFVLLTLIFTFIIVLFQVFSPLKLAQESVLCFTVTMSSTTTPNDSPNATPIQPLHNPANAAHVVVPQAPLGNVVNAPGMGAKALLAKKMAKSQCVVPNVQSGRY
jgi:hypothetical protein